MSDIRKELVNAAINRAIISIDYDIYDDFHKQHEFKKQTILADKSLTNDEKTLAINKLNKTYDKYKIMENEGTRRISNFSNWTSGNNDIDNLIQRCQSETLLPTVWIDGQYIDWDFKEQQLIRFGRQRVVLKGLENVESANQNQRWFEEAKSHFSISNKWPQIVQCYGLTQDPSNGNYMLVINNMDTDLRKYLQQTQNQLKWEERIKIALDISIALKVIHRENAIHRDLHSGNILYLKLSQEWYISDLGFCGPVNKSSESIYGNLPYIAPEVISGKNTSKESDVYSIAMLMWEISCGQPPFSDYENDYNLALKIINGMRPKVVPGTPLKYENLMKQCWDADPSKRLDIEALQEELYKLLQSYQDNNDILNESLQLKTHNKNIPITNYTSSKLFMSKIYEFKNLPEPRNATEEEQVAFHSKSYDCFNIPDNIDDFNNSSNQNYGITSKASSILKGMSKKLSEVFKKLQLNSNNDNQINYGKEIAEQQQINKYNVKIDDEDEIYDDKNFHSEEQDELEIPDGGF
ncbi:kinase-like domain-containing protein [Rhizophagus clarus]|uniref:Kinase-like domain-containing protein n=1 Tax=Rhizophagus clarus TaxID=94130 RepID=A0A8H3KXW2_9GLOM|nr:kinase-like domain-containing protein [Rhizophagus clarus]